MEPFIFKRGWILWYISSFPCVVSLDANPLRSRIRLILELRLLFRKKKRNNGRACVCVCVCVCVRLCICASVCLCVQRGFTFGPRVNAWALFFSPSHPPSSSQVSYVWFPGDAFTKHIRGVDSWAPAVTTTLNPRVTGPPGS